MVGAGVSPMVGPAVVQSQDEGMFGYMVNAEGGCCATIKRCKPVLLGHEPEAEKLVPAIYKGEGNSFCVLPAFSLPQGLRRLWEAASAQLPAMVWCDFKAQVRDHVE